jgi:hypothetical protein
VHHSKSVQFWTRIQHGNFSQCFTLYTLSPLKDGNTIYRMDNKQYK